MPAPFHFETRISNLQVPTFNVDWSNTPPALPVEIPPVAVALPPAADKNAHTFPAEKDSGLTAKAKKIEKKGKGF